MFAIGRSTPWGELESDSDYGTTISDANPPYPSLDAETVDELIGYKRYKSKYFVVPDDTSADLIVDGVRWRKIQLDETPSDEDAAKEKLIELVKANKSRWIYLDFQLDPTDFIGYTYRQIGLFTDLTILAPATEAMTLYQASEIKEGSGILEAVQNRTPVTRQMDQREVISVVLEF